MSLPGAVSDDVGVGCEGETAGREGVVERVADSDREGRGDVKERHGQQHHGRRRRLVRERRPTCTSIAPAASLNAFLNVFLNFLLCMILSFCCRPFYCFHFRHLYLFYDCLWKFCVFYKGSHKCTWCLDVLLVPS